MSQEDRDKILAGIRSKYVKVAQSPEGCFRYPVGRAGLEFLAYDPVLVRQLPEVVAASFCGVGNPFSLGAVHPGERVLDLGCGGGVDTILAALMVGPSGSVVGVDLVPEMLARAQENAALLHLENIRFETASAESLPFAANSFDVVLSNGVFNLVVDKLQALREVWRVLKPGGRLQMADQILSGELPQDPATRVASWFR